MIKWNIELLKKSANTLNSINVKLVKILFTFFVYFPTVYFVEYLHEDESIEDHSIMETVISCPKLIRSAEFNSKQETTTEEQNREDENLKERLTEDISPHNSCDNVVILWIRFSFYYVFFRWLSS